MDTLIDNFLGEDIEGTASTESLDITNTIGSMSDILALRNSLTEEAEQKKGDEPKKNLQKINNSNYILMLCDNLLIDIYSNGPNRLISNITKLSEKAKLHIYASRVPRIQTLIYAVPELFHIVNLHENSCMYIDGMLDISKLALAANARSYEIGEFAAVMLSNVFPTNKSDTSHVEEEIINDTLLFWKDKGIIDDKDIVMLQKAKTAGYVYKVL
jgi:hypothetical protein